MEIKQVLTKMECLVATCALNVDGPSLMKHSI